MGLFDAFRKRPVIAPPAKKRRVNFDSYINASLGYGNGRDKLAAGAFYLDARMLDEELRALYYSGDVGARIVEKLPDDCFRAGYTVEATDTAKADALRERAKEFNLDKKIKTAIKMARLYGGSLLVFGGVGADPKTPLAPGAPVNVTFCNVVDRRFVAIVSYQENPFLPDYGEPVMYRVTGIGGTVADVHASRVIRFDGVETDPVEKRKLGGWTYSCLQRPYNVLRQFETAYASAATLLSDASQGVIKIQGLIDMIADNAEELQTRMTLLDTQRSAGRALMLDAEAEDFKRESSNLSGLPDLLREFQGRLSSAAEGMPITILFGRSPAGMNSTGDSDFQIWYDIVGAYQEAELKPKHERAYSWLAGGTLPDGFELEYTSLSSPSKVEQADIDLKEAQRDQIYLTEGVVQPEEVAIARFGSGEGQIEIDEDALNASLKAERALLAAGEKRPGEGTPAPTGDPNDPSTDPKALNEENSVPSNPANKNAPAS